MSISVSLVAGEQPRGNGRPVPRKIRVHRHVRPNPEPRDTQVVWKLGLKRTQARKVRQCHASQMTATALHKGLTECPREVRLELVVRERLPVSAGSEALRPLALRLNANLS